LQFTDERFYENIEVTIGAEYVHKTMKIHDKKLKLQITDT